MPQDELDPNVARALDEIVEQISKLRSKVEGLNLAPSDAQRQVTTHLMLASCAAILLRFGPEADDLVLIEK